MRVVAGQFKGHPLRAPRRATRPTLDRVREAVFSMLGPLGGLAVLDLYAGSGALGIEALSRGAEYVDFVESSRPALRALEQNLEVLGLSERATVWRLELPLGLGRLRDALEGAHVVLLDPPYGGSEARRALETLERSATLRADCRVVLEHHTKDEVPTVTGELERAGGRRYVETQITFYGPRGTQTTRAEEPGA